jgi:Tat protein translocase TatB subunit
MLQTGENLIIALLALVVLGPKRLPQLARKVGGWTAELRKAAREITTGLEAEVNEFREVGRDLKAPLDEVKKPLSELRDEVKGFGKEAKGAYEWKGPKPISGPTPEDAMRDYEEMNRLAEEPPSDDVEPAERPSHEPEDPEEHKE